jgi:hypothetical protein
MKELILQSARAGRDDGVPAGQQHRHQIREVLPVPVPASITRGSRRRRASATARHFDLFGARRKAGRFRASGPSAPRMSSMSCNQSRTRCPKVS